MKSSIFSILAILAVVSSSHADQARYETATFDEPVTLVGNNYILAATNSISIAEGEVGELICNEGSGYVVAIKNTVVVNARAANTTASTGYPSPPIGTTIAGPAIFRLQTYNVNASVYSPNVQCLMTVKITPLTYSPQKSVTVAPGMGNVQIELESSTNLLTWAASTNGVYNDDLRFFRVKLTKLNP